MKELDVVRFLLDEIEKQIEYNKQYENEKKKALELAAKYNKSLQNAGNKLSYCKSFYDYLPKEFTKNPNKSAIKVNAMKIRQLMLGLYDRDTL